MTQLERVTKNLQELGTKGVKYCFSKQGRGYFLTLKFEGNTYYRICLTNIERLINDIWCKIDKQTGIIY